MQDDVAGPDGSGLSEGLGPTPRWWHCDTHGPGSHAAWGCPECVREMRAELWQLRHALAQSGKLAEDRLQQMKADRAQALRWRAALAELPEPSADTAAEVERLRQALRDIAEPIAVWQRELQPGYTLDGGMCVHMANDPETYKRMAREALKA